MSQTTRLLVTALCFAVFGGAILVWFEAQSVSAARIAMRAHWEQHREECLKTPIAEYTKDRSRALRGVVRDSGGEPVSGASVRSISMNLLMPYVSQPDFDPEDWTGLVEEETYTDKDGRYTFPYLEVGTRTICVDADAYAPIVESMVTVQDGMGPRLDFALEKPGSLTVTLDFPGAQNFQVCIVPFRWWPEPMFGGTVDANGTVQFGRIGGPFKKGIIMICSDDTDADWVACARYDVEQTNEVRVGPESEFLPSPKDLPQFNSVESGADAVERATRQFYSLLSPMALLWEASPASLKADASENLQTGDLHGFASAAFLPVLLKHKGGASQLAWGSYSAEFDLTGIPVGEYRIRSYSYRGALSFRRAAVVAARTRAEMGTSLAARIDFDDPTSYEIQGMVTWNDGRPAPKAKVVVQDSQDFRRLLKQVTTDSNGFFKVDEVSPGRNYVMFALPENKPASVRNFSSSRVEKSTREKWVNLQLHRTEIVGQVPADSEVERLQLIKNLADGQEEVVWGFVAEDAGAFSVSNFPPGEYMVKSRDPDVLRSHVLNVKNNEVSQVRWAE